MMKTIGKWFGVTFIALLALLAASYGFLRLNDGPIEFFPWFTISIGGPFRSGEIAASPANWDFIKERAEIEFQTLNPTTSRTVWVPVVDGKLFIVSGYMNSAIGKLWKQWPAAMQDDNRVLIRIDGKIYEQRLNRVMDGPYIAPVMAQITRKYFGGSGQPIPGSEIAVTGGSVWMFEVVDM